MYEFVGIKVLNLTPKKPAYTQPLLTFEKRFIR